MPFERHLIALMMVVMLTVFHGRVSCQDPTLSDAIISSNKLIGSTIVNLFINRFLPKNSFVVEIKNNLAQPLVNPVVYLAEGKTNNPPPFVIPAAPPPVNGKSTVVPQTITMQDNPAGMLCYDIWGTTTLTGKPTPGLCISFYTKKANFNVDAAPVKALNSLQVAYTKYAALAVKAEPPSSFLIGQTTYFAFAGQMTTSTNRRLYVEISALSAKRFTYKRAVFATMVFGGALLGGLSSLASVVFNRVTANVGTTLTIENVSTEDANAIVLENPVWLGDGVEIRDIIPYQIGPKQSSKVTIVAPFFEKSPSLGAAISLSFQVKGDQQAERRFVVTIWWKRVAGTSPNEYVFSVSSIRDSIAPRPDLETINTLRNYPKTAVKSLDFLQYKCFKVPVFTPKHGKSVMSVSVIASMGNSKENGMIIKIFGWPKGENQPVTETEGPAIFEGKPGQIPPELLPQTNAGGK